MSFASRAIALFALVLAALPSHAAQAQDPLELRLRGGQDAVRAEISALEGSRRSHAINADSSVRLALLTIALTTTDRVRYERSVRRVFAERDRLALLAREAIAGRGYETAMLNARWLNSAMASRDPDVRELLRRIFVDQYHYEVRLSPDETRAFRYLGDDLNEQLIRENADWLRAVLSRIGWFDISRYGSEASQAAWLLVQHADHDPGWQRQILRILEPRVARGDMQPNYFAYLVDRVAVNASELQTYGTQGRCVPGSAWQEFTVRDPGELDSRRQAVGLEPIAAYRARFRCR